MKRLVVYFTRFTLLIAIAATLSILFATSAPTRSPYMGALSIAVAADMEPVVCGNYNCDHHREMCLSHLGTNCTHPTPTTCETRPCP